MYHVLILRRMLALIDHYLDASSKILDFGCGSGEAVYEFRDAGFDARGFDIHDYLALRLSQDRQFFDIADNGLDKSIMTVDWANYRLPYADATFDFVMSMQTLEHVLNLDAVVAELARITKPGGIGIHVFPSKYRLIEAHTFVPFGGMTQSFTYNLFWAALGIRNGFQKGMTAVDVARTNARYARTGTRYLPSGQIRNISQRHFEFAWFGHELWHFAGRIYGVGKWRLTQPALSAYSIFNQVVLVLEKPLHQNSPLMLNTDNSPARSSRKSGM